MQIPPMWDNQRRSRLLYSIKQTHKASTGELRGQRLAIKILWKMLAHHSLRLIPSRSTRSCGQPWKITSRWWRAGKGFFPESDVAVQTCEESGGLGLETRDIVLSSCDLRSAGGSLWVLLLLILPRYFFFYFIFFYPATISSRAHPPRRIDTFFTQSHLREEPHIPKTFCPIGAAAMFPTDLCFTLTPPCCRGLGRALCYR